MADPAGGYLLQGALLIRPDDWESHDNKEYSLSFVLSGSDIGSRCRSC